MWISRRGLRNVGVKIGVEIGMDFLFDDVEIWMDFFIVGIVKDSYNKKIHPNFHILE